MRRISRLGVFSGLAAVIVAGAGLAFADHGTDFIDLASQPNLEREHDGALFIQGGVGAGTGTFDPFLTANSSGNANTQSAINVCVDDKQACPDPQADTFTGGGRTHHLNLAAVPELEIDGTLYREFSLDANDQGGEDFMSIDLIRTFLDTEKTAGGYNPNTGLFATNTGPQPFPAWDLEIPILMRSQTFTPGSGVSDITVLVPSDEFVTPEDCSYGSQDCIHFLYFYYEAGGTGAITGFSGVNWNVTAGFEEWRTRLLPAVDVDKSAAPSFDRDFDWTVTKEVSLSDTGPWVESESVDLFDGQSDTVYWRINVAKGEPQDSGQSVSGTITIFNPTGGEIIEEDIDAEILDVEDVIDGVGDVTVECGESFPFTLEPQETLVCTYESALPDTTARTNTATVTIEDDLGGQKEYIGTADIDFTDVDPTITDDTADLTDELLDIDEEVSASVVDRIESTEVDCDDEGTITNTAVITESDSGDFDENDADVTITCYSLTVTKDATPSFDREFDWTVTKEVSLSDTGPWVESESVDLFDGQSDTVYWRINVTKSSAIDSGYAVLGTITITNPAPIAAVNVSVGDALSGGITATVDCDPVTVGNQTTVTVGANDSETCSYSATLPDDTTRTNTATASLAGEDYTGTAEVNFAGVTPTETDATVDVTDTYAGFLGQLTATPPDPFEHTFSYQRTVEGSTLLCGDNLIENTATFVTTDTGATDSADEDVTITVICQTGQGCTPGFWQGGVGFDLWNVPGDPDFPPPGGNGDFSHDLPFNDFFASHPSLDGLSMIELVGTGGGNDPVRRAARSLVAAYLNALADGVSYDYTTGELQALWTAAVTDGSPGAFKALHGDLDEKNNLGADLCGFPEEETLEASALGAAAIAILAWLVFSTAWRGRHGRRLTLLDE